MRNSKPWLSVAMTAAMAFCSATAWASSHREAPAISNDPAADNTDLWAWMSSDGTTLHVVASYIPLEEPSGGPNFHKFSDDVLYEIHITDPGTLADGGPQYDLNDKVVYQVMFNTTHPAYQTVDGTLVFPDAGVNGAELISGATFFSQISGAAQTYTVTRVSAGGATVLGSGISVAPPNIGPSTDSVAYGATYNAAFAASFIHSLSNGGQVWAGPRDDGFYVDLGGIFDLANLRGPALLSDGGANPGAAQDGVAGFNCHTISIDIPMQDVFGAATAPHHGTPGDDSTIGVWASASRKKVSILNNDGSASAYGPWVQVSRLGLPLINEAVIGLQDKDKYNRTQPTTDVANFAGYFLNPVIVGDADAVGIYTALGAEADVPSLASGRTDILNAINLTSTGHNIPIAAGATGDVLRVDAATASVFPNGRALPETVTNVENADVTDVMLTLLLSGGAIPITDNVNHNDTNYPGVFPYLALPWQGYSQGHGKPTP